MNDIDFLLDYNFTDLPDAAPYGEKRFPVNGQRIMDNPVFFKQGYQTPAGRYYDRRMPLSLQEQG